MTHAMILYHHYSFIHIKYEHFGSDCMFGENLYGKRGICVFFYCNEEIYFKYNGLTMIRAFDCKSNAPIGSLYLFIAK